MFLWESVPKVRHSKKNVELESKLSHFYIVFKLELSKAANVCKYSAAWHMVLVYILYTDDYSISHVSLFNSVHNASHMLRNPQQAPLQQH